MAWESDKKPTVCICLPHVGSWTAEFTDKCYVTLKAYNHQLFNKTLQLSRGTPLDIAREELVEKALEDKNNTHIFFLDTDMIPEKPKDINECIASLLAVDSPIVSGIYKAKQKSGFPYAAWYESVMDDGKKTFTPIQGWTGNFFSVDVTGLGCSLIKREVFEKIERPWFSWDYNQPSEDFYFFLKAKKYGFPCWIYADVAFSHVGEIKILTDGTFSTMEV